MLYDYCFYYQDGYAIVTKDGGHGKQNILDRQGNLILDNWYDCVNLDEPYYICQNKTGESEIRDLDMNIVASGESWTLTDGLDTSISVEYDGYYGIGINMQYDDKHVSIEHFKDNIFTYRKLGGTLGLFAIHKIPDEITVTVNGEALEFDQQPIMDSDRVLCLLYTSSRVLPFLTNRESFASIPSSARATIICAVLSEVLSLPYPWVPSLFCALTR